MINFLVLAIGAAISPSILAVVIVVLSRPNPKRLLFAYLAGGFLTSISVGVVIVTSLNELDLASGSSSAADPALNFTVGALLLLVAYVLATDRDARLESRRREKRASRPTRDPWSERVLSHGNTPIAFAVGIVLSLPGGFYLIALKDIAVGEHGFETQFLAIVLFNLIMFALAEVPLLGYLLAPEKTTARVKALNDGLSSHARQLVIAIAVLMGLYLVGRGLLGVL